MNVILVKKDAYINEARERKRERDIKSFVEIEKYSNPAKVKKSFKQRNTHFVR